MPIRFDFNADCWCYLPGMQKDYAVSGLWQRGFDDSGMRDWAIELREQLLATGEAQLIEGNTWNDTFWGVCKGKGQNWLGRILVEVREELAEVEAA